MNRALVDPIANAVLYEGYILYPYRPSIKNRQRWTFGGLFPDAYCQTYGGETSSQQTECLIRGTPETTLEAVVRFLHLTARQVGEIEPPLPAWPAGEEPPFRPVESLHVGNERFQSWQEAEECEAEIGEVSLGELCSSPRHRSFAFDGGRRSEPILGPAAEVVGVLIREQQDVEAVVKVAAVEVEDGLFRLTLRVSNQSLLDRAGLDCRDQALLHSLVSTHAILGVERGTFVSLMDPPERWRGAAEGCRNVGVWPVLAGEEERADMMLSSPIILYDYPQVAPESLGDLFDGTEIDEILTLRIMTLTDEEKSAIVALDDRAGALLARTEALAREQLSRLHGTFRGLRTPPGEHP